MPSSRPWRSKQRRSASTFAWKTLLQIESCKLLLCLSIALPRLLEAGAKEVVSKTKRETLLAIGRTRIASPPRPGGSSVTESSVALPPDPTGCVTCQKFIGRLYLLGKQVGRAVLCVSPLRRPFESPRRTKASSTGHYSVSSAVTLTRLKST
jgi:hypothetical protein